MENEKQYAKFKNMRIKDSYFQKLVRHKAFVEKTTGYKPALSQLLYRAIDDMTNGDVDDYDALKLSESLARIQTDLEWIKRKLEEE